MIPGVGAQVLGKAPSLFDGIVGRVVGFVEYLGEPGIHVRFDSRGQDFSLRRDFTCTLRALDRPIEFADEVCDTYANMPRRRWQPLRLLAEKGDWREQYPELTEGVLAPLRWYTDPARDALWAPPEVRAFDRVRPNPIE